MNFYRYIHKIKYETASNAYIEIFYPPIVGGCLCSLTHSTEKYKKPAVAIKEALTLNDWLPAEENENTRYFLGLDRKTDWLRLAGCRRKKIDPLEKELNQLKYYIEREGGKPDFIISKKYTVIPGLRCIVEESLTDNEIYIVTSSSWSLLTLQNKDILVCHTPGWNGRLILASS